MKQLNNLDKKISEEIPKEAIVSTITYKDINNINNVETYTEGCFTKYKGRMRIRKLNQAEIDDLIREAKNYAAPLYLIKNNKSARAFNSVDLDGFFNGGCEISVKAGSTDEDAQKAVKRYVNYLMSSYSSG